jgi:hypothetical protein
MKKIVIAILLTTLLSACFFDDDDWYQADGTITIAAIGTAVITGIITTATRIELV